MYDSIYFILVADLKVTSIVKPNGTFLNNKVTSKDIILKLLRIFCPSICVMNSLVYLLVYSDFLRSDKSLAKYFASWCDAVLILN